MRNALIFNPYLDTLGGGEFYTLLVVDFLIKNNFSLEIAWPYKDILAKITQRFGLKLENRVKINNKASSILKKSKNLLQKYLFSKDYQLIFYISDGSIPFLFGKINWLLFQAPFQNVDGRSLLNQIKLRNIHQVLCYSNFVKKFIDKEYKVDAKVVYPAISDSFFCLKPIKKENIILSVGRFDQIMNAKKQDVLVSVFKQMFDKGLRNWQLVLLGGLMKENSYFKTLKKLAHGYPIKIMTNIDFKTLVNYYQKAKIYWHAAGYGENLDLYPEKAEHFGISILEAMVSGAVPLIYNAGGSSEIIGENKELLWLSKKDLEDKTKLLINNELLLKRLRQLVAKRAHFFNQENFLKKLTELLL